jgi:putative methyltransferase (TIGR04325 family)
MISIKDFFPPIFLKILKSIVHTPSYKTYEEALKYCSNESYENIDIAKVVVEKNLIYKQKINQEVIFDYGAFRTLIGVSLATMGDSLRVVDFGGGGGYHYTLASKAFENKINFKWNVVETSAIVSHSNRMSNQNLKFFNNISEAVQDLGDIDLVFTSGALHCCPDPLFFLKNLVKVNARHLFITRTSFTELSEPIVNVHRSFLSTNGPGPLPNGFNDKAVFYPNVFVPIKIVEAILCENYDINFKIIEETAAYVVAGEKIDMFGYFCTRKN